jgi:integrase
VARRISKYPLLRAEWPRILDYRDSGVRSFAVDGRRRGNGRRYYFRKLADAVECAKRLTIQREQLGNAVLKFSHKDLVMAAECAELLAPSGKTILDAAHCLLAQLAVEHERSASPTIKQAAAEFIVVRQRDVEQGSFASRSLVELRHSMKHLVARLGDLRLIDLSVEQVTRHLDSLPKCSLRTRKNRCLRLSAFFSFCQSNRWISSNPCAEIKVKIPHHDVILLSLDQCEQLLRNAAASEHKKILVPYVSICLFAGLRPFECRHLDWGNVDLHAGHIFVEASTSKKRESRYTQIEPALGQFLSRYAKPSGRICGANFRRQWESLLTQSGFGPKHPWPQDCLRHTGASMLLGLKRDRALVAHELGTSVEVLRRFYIQPLTKAEVQRFWGLRPASDDGCE